MQFDPQFYSDRFDHILSDIEAGHGAFAVATLSGLLDAASTEPDCQRACREILLRHPLHRIVNSPAIKHAVATLGFARADAARRALSASLAQSCWSRGKRLCLFECSAALDIAQSTEADLSNLTLVSHSPETIPPGFVAAGGKWIEPATFLAHTWRSNTGFDLILAPAIADLKCKEAILRLGHKLAARAVPGGQLCLSAYAPNHLGYGWQTICLARELHCHDEVSFTDVANQIGATLSCFRDASGALVWADFKLTDHAT